MAKSKIKNQKSKNKNQKTKIKKQKSKNKNQKTVRLSACSPLRLPVRLSVEKMFIYPKIKHKSQLYLRYVDDISLLWTGTETELKHYSRN